MSPLLIKIDCVSEKRVIVFMQLHAFVEYETSDLAEKAVCVLIFSVGKNMIFPFLLQGY